MLRTQSQILRTKLYRPRLSREMVVRPRLMEQLDQSTQRLVTLIVAPAGYGKTTIISQWLDRTGYAWGWISLDQYDSEPASLATYIVAAVQASFPDFGQATQLLSAALQMVPTHLLADALVSDLLEITDEFVLVLDDAHLLTGEEVNAFLERVITYMPYNVHLLLTGRMRPDLPLARLRLQGQLSELGVSDLAFNEEEAGELLSLVAGRNVGQEFANLLDQKTEGWAAGLQLAGLALRNRDEREIYNEVQRDPSRAVVDYLVDEVIAIVPPDMRHFMLRTSVLDSLSGASCTAVLAGSGTEALQTFPEATAMLRRIEEAQLFLIPLDDARRWYRYHHLLQQTLLGLADQTHGQAWVADAHRRASAWYRDQGLITEAIHHVKAAGDEVEAARLVEGHYHLALDREEKLLLSRWIQLIPDAMQNRPGILLVRAWEQYLLFRPEAAAALAMKAAAALDAKESAYAPDQVAEWRTEVSLLNLQAAYFGARPATVEQAVLLLEAMPRKHRYATGIAAFSIMMICQRDRRIEEALRFASEFYQENLTPDAATLRAMLGQCAVLTLNGQLSDLESAARSYAIAAEQTGSKVSQGWAKYFRSLVAYERNELDLAKELISGVLAHPHELQGKTASDAFSILCQIHLAQGRVGDAEQVHSHYVEFLDITQNHFFKPVAAAVGCLIHQAATVAGRPVSGSAGTLLPVHSTVLQMSSIFLHPVLVEVQQRLLEEDTESMRQALDLLEELEALIVSQNEQIRLVKLFALRAVVHARLGEEAEALSAMREALQRGQRERFIRSVVDLGPDVEPLLAHIRASGQLTGHIDTLLAALKAAPADRSDEDESFDWHELTNRELDVLERLQRRMSNKEIARELYLSPLTVKRHAQNLYRKLGASNRREAVELARQYDILRRI